MAIYFPGGNKWPNVETKKCCLFSYELSRSAGIYEATRWKKRREAFPYLLVFHLSCERPRWTIKRQEIIFLLSLTVLERTGCYVTRATLYNIPLSGILRASRVTSCFIFPSRCYWYLNWPRVSRGADKSSRMLA